MTNIKSFYLKHLVASIKSFDNDAEKMMMMSIRFNSKKSIFSKDLLHEMSAGILSIGYISIRGKVTKFEIRAKVSNWLNDNLYLVKRDRLKTQLKEMIRGEV